MSLERTPVSALARRPGLPRLLMSFVLLLLFAAATLFISSAHADLPGPAQTQHLSSADHADGISVEVLGVHRGQVTPVGGPPCPGAAEGCCGTACGAFAHMTVAPGVPVPSASARLIPSPSQAAPTVWRSAAFRPPIS